MIVFFIVDLQRKIFLSAYSAREPLPHAVRLTIRLVHDSKLKYRVSRTSGSMVFIKADLQMDNLISELSSQF